MFRVHIDISEGEKSGKYRQLADLNEMAWLQRQLMKLINDHHVGVADSRMHLCCEGEDFMRCHHTFLLSSKICDDGLQEVQQYLDDWEKNTGLIDTSINRTDLLSKVRGDPDDLQHYIRFWVRWYADY